MVGLDDLTRKQQGNRVEVLRCLHRLKGFSIFEATENDTIASTLDWLKRDELIEVDKSSGFPWVAVELTAKGLAMIGGSDARA